LGSRITRTGPVPRTQGREHATRHHGQAGGGEAQIMPAYYQEGQVIQVTTVDVAHGGWCVARPDDVTGAVLFLASDQAGFITGQTLSVSGGYTMM